MQLSRVFIWILSLSITVAIVGSIFLASGGVMYVSGAEQFVIGIAQTIPFTLPAIVCSQAFERRKLPEWMISGLIMTGIAWVIAQTMIWTQAYDGANWKTWNLAISVPSTWAGLMMLIAVLVLPRVSTRWGVTVRRVSYGLAVLIAIAAIIFAVSYPFVDDAYSWQIVNDFSETMSRIIGAIAILYFTGLITVYGGSYWDRLNNDDETTAERFEFTVTCPRCESVQMMHTEGDNCTRCGLGIKVTPT